MTTGERWMRNTADFTFRAVGVLAILGIAEIFTDFNWGLVLGGLAVWWFFFCCFRTPLGYKRDESGNLVDTGEGADRSNRDSASGDWRE